MNKQSKVFDNFKDHDRDERKRRLLMTPEERLDEVEHLRIEGGKFLYEYPARLQRVIKVTRTFNDISGVKFEVAWHNRVRGRYGDVTVNFIGRAELIKNKTSTDRPKDKLDAEELQEK